MISGLGLSNAISVRMGGAKYEVADVLRLHLAEYRERYPLTAEQARVCGALMACRTAQLGDTSINALNVAYSKSSITGVGIGTVQKELRLPAVAFIRRFLWHVLPAGFVRIRHYGLHHSSARKEKLPRCRQLLGLEPELPERRELGLREWLATFIDQAELDRCPACGAQQTLARQREFDEVSWSGLLFLGLFGLKGYQAARL